MSTSSHHARSRSRVTRLAALVAAGALVAGLGATASSVVGAAPSASAATTTQLTTAASRVALTKTLATSAFPSGSSKAVITESQGLPILVAGNLSSRTGSPALVSGSGSSTADVLATLKQLKATSVTLVSSTTNYFTSAFVGELTAASISVSATLSSSDTYDLWSKSALQGSKAAEYIFARTDDAAALSLATAYAGASGYPLVVFAVDTPADKLTSLFKAIDTSRITVIGKSEAAPVNQMSEAQSKSFQLVNSADPAQAFIWTARQEQIAGLVSSRVVAVPQDSLEVIALSGSIARAQKAVLAPAGNAATLTTNSRATEYLKLWKNATAQVNLVGYNLTAANLSTLAQPTSQAHAAAPAFRVSDLTRISTGGFKLTTTTVSGATAYNAYDFDGLLVATSTTPTISFPTAESVSGLLITAEKSTGEIARFDLRSNDYSTDAARSSTVAASTSNGTANIRILSSLKVPRLVTRVTIDPFDMASVPSSELPVAITCSTSFTEAGLDATKQYDYAVSDLTNVNSTACDSAVLPAPGAAAALNSAQLSLPPTSFPVGAMARSAAPAPKSAGLTVTDRLISSSSGASNARTDGSMSIQAAGDDYPDLLFRWQAYIPESKVPFPGWTGTLGRNFFFHGDGHGTNQPNASARFTQDLTFDFGSDHDVRYAETMGETIKYDCFPWGADCRVVARATASLNELNWSRTYSANTSAAATLRAKATIPLVSIAPPIDTDVKVIVGVGISRMFGYHDAMPQHEAYIGVPNSEWHQVYRSPYAGYAQLPCLYSAPDAPLPGCGVYFNTAL